MEQHTRDVLLNQTALIVSSHLSKNPITQENLPGLIREVFSTLFNLGSETSQAPEPPAPSPAVPVKKSVFPDHIVCLEDGMKLKMLKRHLMTSYQMTPDEYRKRWGLPPEYPMVAPNYAQTRSSLAKKIGLGLRRTAEPEETKPLAEASMPQVRRYTEHQRGVGRPRRNTG